MAFLQQVLNVKESSRVEDMSEKLVIVHRRVGNLKFELSQSLNACFQLYDSDLDKIKSWRFELITLDKDVNGLCEDFSHMKVSQAELNEESEAIKNMLEETAHNITLLTSIIEIIQNLESAEIEMDPYLASQRLETATKIWPELKSKFPSMEDNPWIKSLSYTLKKRISEAYDQASTEWNSLLKFEKNTLYILEPVAMSKSEGNGRLNKLLATFKALGMFEVIWERFIKELWNEILSKACSINHEIRVGPFIPVKQEGGTGKSDVNDSGIDGGGNRDSFSPTRRSFTAGICIFAKKLSQPIKDSKDVFQNLIITLAEMQKLLEEEWMSELLGSCSSKLSKALSSDFLNILILSNSRGDLENVKNDIENIKDFLNVLRQDFRFSLPQENPFVNFERNFEGLFRNQVRQDLLSSIRKLIHNNVNTIRIDLIDDSIESGEECEKSPFQLGQYTINLSISEMIGLLRTHLDSYPSDMYIIENAYNFYVSIAPLPKIESDSDDFANLQAVLTHNNCWFLIHHAMNTFEMLDHMIPLLQEKASKAFAFVMRNWRVKFNGLVGSAMSGLEDLAANQKEDVTNKFLKVFAEFSELHNTYKTVLPAVTWRETLASLVDHTMNEICLKILGWDDISEVTGTLVSNAMSEFSYAISQLFKKRDMTQTELENLVLVKLLNKWLRFRLMIFILTASLRDIDDKWVGGCGPLAIEFSPDEIRKLVRALFQNNERRAAFLKQIK